MVLTVTLNPAVDKNFLLPNLVIGQVNRVRSAVNIPGGKGINVARIIRQMRGEVIATGFLGGCAGNFIESTLKKSMECKFIKVSGETRSNINIIGEDGYVTEVLEPGPTILPEEVEIFLKRYQKLIMECEVIVLSGSVPKGIDTGIYKELIDLAKRKGKKVFLDSSRELLQKGIEAKPFFIKPNSRELEYVLGIKLNTTEQIVQAASMIREKGVENVLVSRGEKGSIYVGAEGNFLIKVPRIKAINTVGSGDSMVAVIAMGIEQGKSIPELLKTATAVSVANATTMQSGQIPLEKIMELETQVVIEEL